MKNLVKSIASVFALGVLWTSCNTDPCKDVECGTQGTCTEGLCICANGYEKDSLGKCETKWSAKFLGNYNVSDTCSNPPANYLYASTATETSATAISMSNFAGFNNPLTIDITSSFDATVASTDAGGRAFSGTGSISGNVMTLNYIVTFTDGTKDTCTATYTQQ